LSKTAAKPEPAPKRAKLDRSRRQRLAARQVKAERNVRLFNLLKSGVPIAEIALQEGLSVRRARELVQEMLERREVDPPAGFAQLQIGRLSDAMMVAYAAMMEGNLQALDRVLRIVGELDRRHGFCGAPAEPAAGATRALAAPAPALALPAPADAAEDFLAKD
jgi:DNA-binding CsgD family transcriptional regulator